MSFKKNQRHKTVFVMRIIKSYWEIIIIGETFSNLLSYAYTIMCLTSSLMTKIASATLKLTLTSLVTLH